MWLNGLGIVLCRRLPIQFPVRAHALVVRLIPGWGCVQEEDVPLSLDASLYMSFSFPLSIEILFLKSRRIY